MTRPDVGVMRELLARVKAAKGADRALWFDIVLTLLGSDSESEDISIRVGRLGLENSWVLKDGTAEFDTAAALLKCALPDWGGRLTLAPSKNTIQLWHLQQLQKGVSADGATPALAVLAALLTALLAAEDRHG